MSSQTSGTHTRVAVTGLGIISPGATGIAAFRELLAGGVTAIEEITRFDTAGLRAHKAGHVAGFKARDFIAPMKLRRMNNLSRFGVSAARLAVNDLGVEAIDAEPGEIGVAVGSTFGPVQTSEDYLQEYVSKGAALAPPQLFAESVANAPGSHIAIEMGWQGFNLTFTQRESSAMSALLYASSQIARATVRAALCGGVEEMNEMAFSVLDRVGALGHGRSETPEASRPFDRRRNGVVVGEGAAMYVLESTSRRTTEKAPYAYISGFGISRDGTARLSDWGEDADAVTRAMRAAIDDAGLELSSIDAIWASANSSVRGDRLEYRAIQALFGMNPPPVVATKGYYGEYAAAGGLHLASVFVAMHEQRLPRSPGFEEGEEEMRIDITRELRATPLRHILVNSLSAGGGIVCAVVSRSETE